MASRKSSILKPLRAREPLQDLSQLIPNNDEEETTTTDTHKRRVSFACVNKIKEFEAGAECLTLLHTPAYDERFSISSDSYQSSLNENSRDKSMFNSNIELPKSPNISKHKVNDENVEVVEVDLFNVSRGAPSPGKMSAGDSSMDMTNMIAPHEITEYESEIENCYPLNLTKNVQLGSESQHFDEDILESSSMETTEALPCLITETMRTSQSEIFTQEAETSVEEETLYDCQEPTSPEQIIVRKSEIFLRDKPAVKRLSSEMIDPEEQDVVTVKRRSLTNDSCSDESNANIEQIVRNDRRKSVFPQSYVENQNIKSFLIREEKSTIINIDNAHHRAEVKEIKNVDVNIAYEKTCPKEIITGNQETLDIKNNENKSTSPQRNQGGELVHDVSLMTSQPEKHNTSDILASEPAVDGSNDTQPVKETRVPLSARKSSIPIAVCTKTAPVSRKSIIVANDDNKTAGNTSNISVNDTINVSKDMDITNAFHKTTHETFVKCLSQNTTNDAVKEMELTTALHKNTCLNKTDDSTKDMELSSALGENSQGIRVKGNSPEKPDDGAEMAELSREKPVEGIPSNKTIMVAEDMELSNVSPQNSQETLVKGISSNKTIDVTKEMDFTNLSSQNSQEIPLKSTSSNKTIDVTKEMELIAVSHQNHREITVKDIPSNKTIDGTREVELFVSFEENDREIANKVDEATKDAANIGIVGQKEGSNEVKDVENKGAISTEKLPLNCTIENDNGSQDTTATPPTVQEISCQFVAANTNHKEIMAEVREEVEEIISLVCSENNSDGIRTNISSINDISKIIIDDDDNEKILETSRKCENTSSMIAECDASNLKAANITGDLTMCISQEENEVVTPAGNGSSLEIIKSSSPDVIQVVESSEDSVKSIASQEIQMNEIDPRFEEEKLKVLDNLKKLVKREIPHWSIKSIRSDEWIFDALWNRLQLKIIFGGRGNSCNAELHFIPKQPIIEDKELKKKAAQGDEVLKISVGPIIRKYKPKLDLFCSKVNDVVHLLHIISPDIIFAQQFAENFTNTILSYDIKLLKGMASFYVSSFKNQKMVKIEICLKMLERLSLSSMKVTQVIGNVDVNLIHDTFCEAGRDHDFFSLFVKKLWEKIEG